MRDFRVLNHECEDTASLVPIGTTRAGAPALFNRHWVEAHLWIITGFIEPHFFAGFSGGPKGIMPGCAGPETVLSNHGAHNIADPNAAFGITRGNPIWEEMRELALRAGPSFLLDVTLNETRAITGVFAGDLIEAHRRGTDFVRAAAMRRADAPFDVVVTTKRLSAGHESVSGRERPERWSVHSEAGRPAHSRLRMPRRRASGSPMERLHHSASSLEELLRRLLGAPKALPEQWQAQIQALIQRRADVRVFSLLPDDVLRACHLEPCRDIAQTVGEALRQDSSRRVAVLPQGPLTIPYLAG